MYTCFHHINEAYQVTLDAASANSKSAPSSAPYTQALGNPHFRSCLASEEASLGLPTLSRLALAPMSPDNIGRLFRTDSWIVAKYQDPEGTSLISGPIDFILPGYDKMQPWDPEYKHHYHVTQKLYHHEGA